MKTTNVKLVFCRISAGFALGVGILLVLISFYCFSYAELVEDEYFITEISLDLVIGILLIVFGSLSLKANYYNKLWLSVILLILLSLWLLSSIGQSAVGGIILSLTAIIFKIVSMCIKAPTDVQITTETTSVNAEKPNKTGIENKIAELKHLKELGVITDEQYEEAVQKAVTSIM